MINTSILTSKRSLINLRKSLQGSKYRMWNQNERPSNAKLSGRSLISLIARLNFLLMMINMDANRPNKGLLQHKTTVYRLNLKIMWKDKLYIIRRELRTLRHRTPFGHQHDNLLDYLRHILIVKIQRRIIRRTKISKIYYKSAKNKINRKNRYKSKKIKVS